MSAEQHTLQRAIDAMKNKQPDVAERIARAQLIDTPSSLPFLQVLGRSLITQQRFIEAQQTIQMMLDLAPDFAPGYEDMGSLFAMQSDMEKAVSYFERALKIQPGLNSCRNKLTHALNQLGRFNDADSNFGELVDRDDGLRQMSIAAEHWRQGRVDEAIPLLKNILRTNSDNVDALRFLALCLIDKGNSMSDAEALLRRAIQIAPDFTQGLHALGSVLVEQNKRQDAIGIYQQLHKLDAKDEKALMGLASSNAYVGDCDAAIEAYEKCLALKHHAPGVHMSYAHMLKTVGESEKAIKHYRTAIEQKPDLGESYWSLANLKMFNFTADEITEMEQQVNAEGLSKDAKVHLHFSLGKAYEDNKNFEKAWHHYHTGNQQNRQLVEYDPVHFELQLQDIKDVFTEAFINQHKGHGFDDPAPIFIVGLPRTGSTLTEQILSSHSLVEGTAELSNIGKIAQSTGKYRRDGLTYPQTLETANKRDWAAYGREYIEQTRHHRVLNKVYFIDKMPNNFMHVGWIKMILPNAKIINTRRSPVESCLGAYKQLFAQGQTFSYDMLELAEYYKVYDDLMSHWHQLFPGEILDVHYEHTVTDLESQVKRILDFCQLDFEQGCIDFHQNKRRVKTASSEQVRQPIYSSALNLSAKYGDAVELWREELAEVIAKLPADIQALIKN